MGFKVKEIVVLILQFMVTSVILGTMLQVIRGFMQGRRDAYADRKREEYLANKKAEEENDPFNDPDVMDFLEQADKQGSWGEDDDKPFTIGGLTADKDQDFKKFINKLENEEEEEAEQ